MSDHDDNRRFVTPRRRLSLAFGSITLAGAGTVLAGCGDAAADGKAYFASVAECQSSGEKVDFCDRSYRAALAAHERTAPSFETMELCEAEWGDGNCTVRTGPQIAGQGAYVPAMEGFLVAQTDERQNDEYHRSHYGYYYMGRPFFGYPIYRDRSGQNVTLTRGTGDNSGTMQKTAINTKSLSASRGGFGSRGFSRGGGSRFGG